MREWINKQCKIFVKDLLSDGRILHYTCTVISVSADEKFITIIDKMGEKITLNTDSIIQIKEGIA